MKKIKVSIDKDEWWPVYSLGDRNEPIADWESFTHVSPGFYKRYKKALAEFEAVQSELARLPWLEKETEQQV